MFGCSRWERGIRVEPGDDKRGDGAGIVEIQHRQGAGIEGVVAGDGDDGGIVRVQQRVAEGLAVQLDFGERHVAEAFDQYQVDGRGIEPGDEGVEVGVARLRGFR